MSNVCACGAVVTKPKGVWCDACAKERKRESDRRAVARYRKKQPPEPKEQTAPHDPILSQALAEASKEAPNRTAIVKARLAAHCCITCGQPIAFYEPGDCYCPMCEKVRGEGSAIPEELKTEFDRLPVGKPIDPAPAPKPVPAAPLPSSTLNATGGNDPTPKPKEVKPMPKPAKEPKTKSAAMADSLKHLSYIQRDLAECMGGQPIETRKRIMAAIQALFDWEEEYGELVS